MGDTAAAGVDPYLLRPLSPQEPPEPTQEMQLVIDFYNDPCANCTNCEGCRPWGVASCSARLPAGLPVACRPAYPAHPRGAACRLGPPCVPAGAHFNNISMQLPDGGGSPGRPSMVESLLANRSLPPNKDFGYHVEQLQAGAVVQVVINNHDTGACAAEGGGRSPGREGEDPSPSGALASECARAHSGMARLNVRCIKGLTRGGCLRAHRRWRCGTCR